MVSSTSLYLAFLVAIGVERCIEMAISKRNARIAFARGGREYGAGHFPVMAALHTLFLVSCAAEVLLGDRPFVLWLGVPALVLALAAQGLRYWVISTLGTRWNVRIIVVPGLPPVTSGPYRFLRHPNYVAVVIEMLALPLLHGAYATAIVFSLANALLLRVRIRAEEAALGELYAHAFEGRPRFVPSPSHSSSPHT